MKNGLIFIFLYIGNHCALSYIANCLFMENEFCQHVTAFNKNIAEKLGASVVMYKDFDRSSTKNDSTKGKKGNTYKSSYDSFYFRCPETVTYPRDPVDKLTKRRTLGRQRHENKRPINRVRNRSRRQNFCKSRFSCTFSSRDYYRRRI